jgi:hypothetical protein
MIRRQQSANVLLANAQQLLDRRQTPRNKSFYAHVVHTQIRRRLAESVTMAPMKANEPEKHPRTPWSHVVLVLIVFGCMLVVFAWAVLE